MIRLILGLFALTSVAKAYNILVFFPITGKSHAILGEGYVSTLLDDGQQVTYVTPYPDGLNHQNLTLVDLSALLDDMPNDLLRFDKLIDKNSDFQSKMLPMMLEFSLKTVQNANLQKFLRESKDSFDVVIVEWMFSEAFAGLAPLFEAPLIWTVSTDPFWMTLQLIDTVPNPSYTPDVISPRLPPFTTLYQRLEQLFYMVAGLAVKNLYLVNKDTEIYENYLRPIAIARGKTLPSFNEARFNASLMLGNSHVSMGAPITMPLNFKPIGGYHIDPEVKPLPDNIKKILDNAKNGVIYMSMGTNLKSKELPAAIKKDLLAMFGQLQQTVIWKFEEELPGAPKNLHILKWAPQAAILNHPNCVLFITHGGLLSTTEAIHYGVPIIGMPVFGDQPLNVQRAVNKGFAKKVDWSYDVAKDLKIAIEDILADPEYSARVQYMSRVYHERPAAPRAELAHWVRHVAGTRGAAGRSWYTRDMYCTRAEYLRTKHELLCRSEVFECYCYSIFGNLVTWLSVVNNAQSRYVGISLLIW